MKIPTQQTTLTNGVRVVTARMSHVDSAAIGVWVGVGGRHEAKSVSGISHFIEHLLFKGTRTRSARDISQAIEGRGGYFNAFTQEESTCYYARIAADYTWEAYDVLADMYLHPRFAKADIDKERGVIIEEIMMYRDRPPSLAEDMLGELLWARHPLGRPLIGTPANIRRMSRSDITGYKQQRYRPANTVITFAGRVDHDECVRRVERSFGRQRAQRARACRKVERGTAQEGWTLRRRPIEQAHLAMGVRLFGRRDRRRYALKLLSVVLGENMSSRLFQVVRERYGLAYSVHSSVQLFDDTGVLAIQAGLDKDRTGKALELTTTELLKVRERPVGRAELQRAKDYAIGQLSLSLESSTSQMMWLGENTLAFNRVTQPEVVIRKLRAVTPEQVQAVARQVIRPARTSIALVVPEKAPSPEEAAQLQRARL